MPKLALYQPPSLTHWLGTDGLGEPVASRLLHATFSTLVSVGLAASIAVLIGAAVGTLLAVTGRSRLRGLCETILGFAFAAPLLLLVLLLLVVFGDQIWVFPSVGLLAWGGIAVVTATSVERIAASDFVAASCALGNRRIVALWSHGLGHVWPTVFSAAAALSVQLFQLSILLAFIGIGQGGLGELIREGYRLYPAVWWTWLPATIISGILLGGTAWFANRSVD